MRKAISPGIQAERQITVTASVNPVYSNQTLAIGQGCRWKGAKP